ncbi:protein-glutamate methylesterase/protein-glutamine glutaminase [Aliikangiella coralliicola]|uniref:Protein-glutamate methylesterase/protein-glutamine glutaminase n=1 Tax=Aliikangiella coralliicola TaxID=2592383 RepID=A0A545UB43_9GAMM|nr:chemotaxis response regulator protein-glutamate methylesterase [Aliikangiella coralliicola]TQV86692.1 chemotaxis response regulator protein-glutamate methylesterase [Aliikangiella coralliicola]
MGIKVLIVDDSQFFCRRVGSILNAAHDIDIVGVANNGQEAIEKAQRLQPDVITLDVEMPIMDGVTALKQIVKVCDARVLMLSSLTYENAKITLDALDAGATDFLLKSYESLSSDSSGLVVQLQKKIREMGKARKVPAFKPAPAEPQDKTKTPSGAPSPARRQAPIQDSRVSARLPGVPPRTKLVAIGASTGGPVALQKVLAPLPANFPYPITVTQHMPGTFTGAFATRLNGLCQLKIVEAQDSMPLQRGHVYIAPGGKQMVFDGSATSPRIRIRPTDPRLQFSPSVDLTFGSASKLLGGDIVAIVLTGMGSDGTEGSRLIKAKGGKIWVQDEATCVVYGMPMSVAKAGLKDAQLPIDQFAAALAKRG